ncbi:MAG: M6 family metalloprotease domain-containing protein [Gaiellales bacterium]|nr:M6 family metalloprotease domain-containing protein [Gaiellales bacterium]
MGRLRQWWMATCLVTLVLTVAIATVAVAAPTMDGTAIQKRDFRTDPLTQKQLELKQTALQARLRGELFGSTPEVSAGQYVELERTGEGAIWTVLGEFADVQHNMIPQPDRTRDNTSIWVPDFGRDYYTDLLFNDDPGANSMRNYYIEQSSNQYTVYGDVTDWVQVAGNAVDYDDNPDTQVWDFLQESIDGWYGNMIAAGWTNDDINAYLSQFDVWDRYDYNGNGNFDEPDGYIDTFQSVHAGLGEEEGGEAWTIWSHSWYAHYELEGVSGPDFNPLGGIQIGDSEYWVGKYTIQPEDGGVGVFTHEFGHDLGLPDLYDYFGENGTGFWTLMSSGSWIDEGKDTIGNKPSHMGAWEKFQLGWLINYDVAWTGQTSTHALGPMEYNSKDAQALFVILPQKQVTEHIADPYEGSSFYFSGSDSNLRSQMTKAFTLSADATLTAKVNYGIEEGYDYANVIISTDDGVTWQTVPTNLSTSSTEPNGIDGSSNDWVDLSVDLSAYTGDVMLGFRYWSDEAVNYDGFMVDNIQITGYALDGAEVDAGWTFTGFRATTGTEDKMYANYYVAEWRTYEGYDRGLKVGPYYFGYANNPRLANWVEHFAYQDGLLINYWDTSQEDNDTALHPGQGLLLPIDAHYKALYRRDGELWCNRIQTYDSTFTLMPTDGIRNIHHLSRLSPVPRLAAVKVFDDTTTYYDPANPLGSVINPNTGTKITLQYISSYGKVMRLKVEPSAG